MDKKIYLDTISYLYSLLPAYQKVGAKAMKKDLQNTLDLCEALGNPQQKFKSVLIAGTNGKGSVSSMLFSVLHSSGYKVGLYTSPHLLDFRERIRVNLSYVSQEYVVDFVGRHKALIEKVAPSFFEFTVAMAFSYFAEQEVEWAIVEVGLGGRLDSTNIIQQSLSVITNISYDHQEFLGDTLEEIAGEKAGIIKSNAPTIIGESSHKTSKIFLKKAQENQSSVYFADTRWLAEFINPDLFHTQISVRFPPHTWQSQRTYEMGLAGTYQLKNLPTVLEAIRQLKKMGVKLPEKAVQTGLINTAEISGLRGRMEVLSQDPLVVVDTAHNEAGVQQTLSYLQTLPAHTFHIVWGMVKDKAHIKILRLLPKDALYYFVHPNLDRGLKSEKLAQKAVEAGLAGDFYSSVKEGVQSALKAAGPSDKIWIGGSTFVVAEALQISWNSSPRKSS
ncbi:MAG: folylpolyglutamate synthase/dihydrofolate synthase family protein [Bacteroidota bacterium]